MEQVGAAARIMSFGYDSNSFFGKSTSDINDVAGMLIDYLDALRQSEEERRRPIIFVAHSLGGIVTKRVNVAWKPTTDYMTNGFYCRQYVYATNDKVCTALF